MKITVKLLTSLSLVFIMDFSYAATSVMNSNSSVNSNSNSSNPYTLFTGEGSSPSTSNSTANVASTNTIPAASSSTAVVTPSPQSSSANSTTTGNTNVTYVQAANQVGQYGTPAAPVQFTQTAKGSNVQPALQAATAGASNYGFAPNPSINSNGAVTGANSNYLQEIMTNTANTQSVEQRLADYWLSGPTDSQLLASVTGYSAIANISTTQANSFNLGNLSSLAPQKDSLQSGIWGSPLEQVITNLDNSQVQMQAIQTAVTNPFKNSNWITQVQSASTPQLLRMLVIEEALKNYIAYQSLQRQQDEELLQATQLRMLAEIRSNNSDNFDRQYQQLRRIAAAVETNGAKGK